MSHRATEVYSGKNPVPKVALKNILDPKGATEAKAKQLFGEHERAEKRQQKAMQHSTKQMEKGREIQVKDPVTSEDTTVKHGVDERDSSISGENIFSMDFPPPDWNAHKCYVLEQTQNEIPKIMAAYIIFPVLTYLASTVFLREIHLPISQSYFSVRQLIYLCFSLIPPSIFAYVSHFALRHKSAEDFADRVWDSERARGIAAGQDSDGDGRISNEERIKESAEWLNAALRGIWPIVNTDLFISAVDMLEDIMQASVPRFIHSVRVADLGQGSNAMRLTSIRSLPDAEIDNVEEENSVLKEKVNEKHVNIEISFTYRALPSGRTARSKAHNAHLLVEFFLGVRGIYEFNLPVWVELTGISGTARARLELIPDPPFIKTTIVTLMGLPRVSVSVVPMAKSLPNVMNIPILSAFISKSIDAVCAEYVAPRSLILDLQQLISGDNIKKDTDAIGVLIIHIHRASGIKKMDTAELSDPYVTVVYSRQSRPLYSTRIIFADLNPHFEETAVITLDANAVKIREKLCLQLWDSDRASADDMLGFVEVDILELMRSQNTSSRRVSYLTSPDSEARPGLLEYTIGYYSKMPPNSKLETDGSDPAIPEDMRDRNLSLQEARAIALNDLEAAVLVTPPDSYWPSGILSIQIHEIRELGIKMEGREKSILRQSRKEGDKGQDDDSNTQEEGSHLPSSYCTISINDELIYSTRVKPITATPTFNAGTERFIRDWRSAHISVAVRDSRMRENDPILGLVFLKLSELLVNASEITRFFPLEHGIGYGSVRISVLFRPIEAKLPPNLLGFDSGTLLIHDISVRPDNSANEAELLGNLQSCEVHLKTSIASNKTSRKSSGRTSNTVIWHEEDPNKLSIHQRYSTALLIAFKKTTGLKPKKEGMAVLWLRHVIDSERTSFDLALFKTTDYKRLKQNYLPPDGNLDLLEDNNQELTSIGKVRIDVTFQPGITRAHKKIIDMHDQVQKPVWDEVKHRDAAGLSEKVGEQVIDGKAFLKTNMGVSQENSEVQSIESTNLGPLERQNGQDDDDESDRDDSDDKKSGLLHTLREWKRHEKELTSQHRGVMQVKPARTVEWIWDGLEETGYKIKDRFKMKPRQPDVETEI